MNDTTTVDPKRCIHNWTHYDTHRDGKTRILRCAKCGVILK